MASAQLFLGWKLHSKIPAFATQLTPSWSDFHSFVEQDAYYKACRKNVCGKWHNAKLMKPEDLLCTKESYENVPVQENAETSCSYLIAVLTGIICHNRTQLVFVGDAPVLS